MAFVSETGRCPICQATGETYRDHSGYVLLRCTNRRCRHVWLRDVPDSEALRNFYDTPGSELWNSGAFGILDDYLKNPACVRRYYARERTKYLERVFPDKMRRPSTRVLDVGCSSGVFLATLRDHGFEVRGQDLGPQAIAAGREALKLELTDEPLTNLAGGYVADVVTCYDVIEHWPDPRALAKAIRGVVAKDAGVVIRTPNHDSWLRVLTAAKWLWYIPPAHIHYFTPESLTTLLEQEGFRIVKVRTGASTYLFLAAYYFLRKQTGAGTGKTFLNMPRWKERLVFGLDDLVKVLASPLLVPARLCQADAMLEVYAASNA